MIFDSSLSSIRAILIEPTWDCPNDCVFCYVPGLKKMSGDHPFVSTPEMIDIIKDLKMQTGVNQICFTGGEPLLRKDLGKLISTVRDVDCAPSLITCGYGVNYKMAEELSTAGLALAEISLHGSQAETHDSLVKRKGDWNHQPVHPWKEWTPGNPYW